jgi:hypothetical protein
LKYEVLIYKYFFANRSSMAELANALLYHGSCYFSGGLYSNLGAANCFFELTSLWVRGREMILAREHYSSIPFNYVWAIRPAAKTLKYTMFRERDHLNNLQKLKTTVWSLYFQYCSWAWIFKILLKPVKGWRT